jgi:hypothetical protein
MMRATVLVLANRLVSIVKWVWIALIAVVLWQHVLATGASNNETRFLIAGQYFAVCLPISWVVAIWLVAVGHLPGMEGMLGSAVMAASFVLAGWFQWFRLAPWLVAIASRSWRWRRAPDQTAE